MPHQPDNKSEIVLYQPDNTGEIVLYQPDNSLRLEVRIENETVWLSQVQMSELFQTTRNNVTMHISNIFKEGELEKNMVCKDFLHTTQHGAIAGKTQERIIKNGIGCKNTAATDYLSTHILFVHYNAVQSLPKRRLFYLCRRNRTTLDSPDSRFLPS